MVVGGGDKQPETLEQGTVGCNHGGPRLGPARDLWRLLALLPGLAQSPERPRQGKKRVVGARGLPGGPRLLRDCLLQHLQPEVQPVDPLFLLELGVGSASTPCD